MRTVDPFLRLFVGTLLLVASSAFISAQNLKLETATQVRDRFELRIQPILKKYCYRCHNQDEMESGIQVDHLDGSVPDKNLKLWHEIRRNVIEHLMPPEDEVQPTAKESVELTNWIKAATDFSRSRPQPKNGSIRRLTVAQYRNTLQELLGVQENVTSSLPPDTISKDGFFNNQQSMLLSPLVLEAYFEIAERVLDQCIVDENVKPVIQNFRVKLGRKVNPSPYPEKLILGANSLLLENQDLEVRELTPPKPFEFEPFRMQRQFRFIEGYRGNATVRGWKEFDSIYHAVFACMRGNGGYPKGLAYETVPEGLVLRPAIPSAELFGVESTYGPKANFKIALRELPNQGQFLIKVKAAKYVGGLLLDKGTSAAPDSEKPKVSVVDKLTEGVESEIPESGIYQVSIHTVPRGGESLTPDSTRLEKNLIGAWSFENQFDNDQSNQKDNAIKRLNGEALGGAKLVDSPFGKSLSLDGKDDSVKIIRNAAMNVGDGDFTVSAWIRPTELRQAGIICLGKYSWTHGWYLDMPNGNGVLRIETASPENQPNGTVQSRPRTIRVNEWQHVAAVVSRNANATKLYVNGYEVARGTIQKKNLDNPDVDLYIGRIQAAHHFKGNIDQVRFYRRALDPAEIQALLAGGEAFLRAPPKEKPKLFRLTLADNVHGVREISGSLYQPEFALVRLAKGSLNLVAKHEGSRKVSRVELTPIDPEEEWGKRFLAFEKRKPKLGVYLGLRRDCGHTLARVGQPKEVTSDEPTEFRFVGAINNFPNPDVEKNNVNYLAGVREIGIRSEYTDGRDMPRLLIHSVEFEGPYYESWPPTSHSKIFIDSRFKSDRPAYARLVIKHFADRAFRRPATADEVDSLMQVFKTSFSETNDFQQSIKDALLVVLTSPQFLFLVEESRSPQAEKLNEFELASKLSYFLWNSPPDLRTLELAEKGQLNQNLNSEMNRMIEDHRFIRFCTQFGRQWLNLDKLDVVNIDRKKYPRLTRDTKDELGREPVEFLKYLVRENLPIKHLIQSEFVVANEVTAHYYQLANLPESGFRFVPVPTRRRELGGLLGQAGILSGLSDGREANPIKRGAWLARKIIAEPPDDPPPNVPELGEDTLHLSLRERLAIHRNQKGCVNCHAGIDPWGLPLEQFDAGGRFQAKANSNAQSVLPDRTKIDGFLSLKKYLAQDRLDQVVFSFVKHLTVYAIGRSLTYNETQNLKRKCLELKVREYPMRDVFALVIQSKMFLEK